MMNVHAKLIRLVSISPEHWDVPMRVELRPYLEFNRRIACQLRDLVERRQGHVRGARRSSSRIAVGCDDMSCYGFSPCGD